MARLLAMVNYCDKIVDPTMGSIVAQVRAQLSHENDVVKMVTELKHSWSHVDWCKFCNHLRSLNIRHYGMV
jgi:hypothetical protein